MKRLNDAFTKLLSLINASGWEFPRAHAHCCLAYALTDAQAIKLISMYDEHCSGGAA